ncbi:MAG: PTS transporter subunit EIIB [Actinomycetaceae bacterium]|nr:PTS transporter subunit EIIB [Actinomycetaceae bacterium]
MTQKALQLIAGLGGTGNLVELEPCMMRIRARVKDPHLVNETLIRQTNPLAVVCSGNYVQIVTGPDADGVVEQMKRELL